MDDNYFDRKLKNILESPPDLPVDEGAFKDMQQKLRADQAPKREGSYWPLLLLSLFLLAGLGGGAFFYTKYAAMDEELNELRQLIQHSNTTMVYDTIYNRKTIYQIDTIYNVIYREKWLTVERTEEKTTSQSNGLWNSIYRNPYYWNIQRFNHDDNWSHNKLGPNSLFAFSPGSSFFSPYHSALRSSGTSSGAVKSGRMIQVFSELDLASAPLGTLPYERRLRPDMEWKEVDHLMDNGVNPLYYFVPTGFRLGLRSQPLVLPSHDLGGSAFALGLSASIELPAQRSLEFGAETMFMNFEVKDDPVGFARFPTVNPDSPGDALHELKGRFTYLQIPILMRQRFRKDARFQPHFSAGIVAYRPLQQKLTYEFLSNNSEYVIEPSPAEGSFSANNVRLGFGADYNFGKRWNTAFELHYQHGFSMNTTEYFPLRYWGMNIGFQYRL